MARRHVILKRKIPIYQHVLCSSIVLLLVGGLDLLFSNLSSYFSWPSIVHDVLLVIMGVYGLQTYRSTEAGTFSLFSRLAGGLLFAWFVFFLASIVIMTFFETSIFVESRDFYIAFGIVNFITFCSCLTAIRASRHISQKLEML